MSVYCRRWVSVPSRFFLEERAASLSGATATRYPVARVLWAALPEGGLAQLARAPALQAGGQRFESVILHAKDIDMMETKERAR